MNRRGLWITVALFGMLFFVLFGLLVITSTGLGTKSYRAPNNNGIGVLEVIGEIGDSKRELRAIRGFESEPSIKAVVLRIDSPGGAVAPSQEIYEELRKLNQKKKVIASMGSVAASGGYYIALGADKIIANGGTLTGSIGVIMQTVDASKLIALTKLEWQTYKSGEYKDIGSPFREATAGEKRLFNEMIQDVYGQFVQAISESRKLPIEAVKRVADGRVLTGKQALEHKLIDQLGTFQTAVDLASETVKMTGKPELVYPPNDDDDNLFVRLMRGGVREASQTAIRELVKVATKNTYLVPQWRLSP